MKRLPSFMPGAGFPTPISIKGCKGVSRIYRRREGGGGDLSKLTKIKRGPPSGTLKIKRGPPSGALKIKRGPPSS